MPEKVGRYEIVEEIGQGGFAVVYRGRDTMLNRLVALKELRHILLQDDDWVKRFQLEARTIAQLDHPHIVPIYDIVQTDGRMFIVMRLANGPSLETMLADQERLSWADTKKMISAIIKGLHYAHSRGVLHRDIKPANILIDDSRGPMLTDFGLARHNVDTGSHDVASQSIVGTPHYIAPEIWEGHAASPQSDVYALGCTLYEMLTGEKRFPGQTPLAVMQAHFEQQPPLLDLLPEDVPAGVDQILTTALSHSPKHRFSSALEMLQALEQPGRVVLKPTPEKPVLASVGPVLATKLYAPLVRHDLVVRPRLTQRMVDGLKQRCKLTLAAAPAGFGKSTLISCWLNALQEGHCRDTQSPLLTEPVKSVWLSLDENDNDPVRFLSYLVAALQKIDPDIGETLHQVPQLPPPQTVASVLINDLTAIDENFVLVLDDYHLIGSGYVHQLIEFLLEHQPPHMHLVITTREDPSLPLPRLRAQGQIVELRQDDLRFTADETAKFLNQTMNLNLSAQVIETLESRTEGWIAGLQLAALSLQGRDDLSVADFIEEFSGSHRYVIDYLVEEVVYQQPKNIRNFLRQTSILDRFSVPLCDAVTDQPDSRLILSYLEQVNLFLIPLDDQRQWYRYHHLFAEFLQSELDPDHQAELNLRAAKWFKENELLSEAIKHSLRAKDIDLAGELIIRAADNALRHGAFYTLSNWLSALPDPVVRTNPELATYKGWVMWLVGDVEASVSYSKSAEAALPDDASILMRGKLLSLQACQAVARETDGIELAQKALPLLEESDAFFSGMTLLVLGEAQNLMGDTEGAVETLQYALRLGRKYQDHFMTIGALVNLAQQYNWQGKRRNAEALCWQAVEQSYDEKGRLLPMAGFSYITLAEVELHTGDLELTYEHLQKGINLTDQYGMIGFSASGKLVLAPLQYALGRPDDALKTMQEVLQIVIEGDFLSYAAVTRAMEAELQLKIGNLPAVTAWAKTLTPFSAGLTSLMREYELRVYARYLLEIKDFEAAQKVLDQLEASARNGGRGLMLILTGLLQTLLFSATDRLEAAREALARAVKMASPEDYKQVFLQEDTRLLALLPQVRQVAPQFVDAVLQAGRQRGLLADAPAAAQSAAPVQLLPEPLTEREIEVLQLIASGQSNKEAADALVVTVGTVKKHLSNIFGKLGVNSRTQAVARARDMQLVE
jgi:LuxR family maltose regulon positive regulatory protein